MSVSARAAGDASAALGRARWWAGLYCLGFLFVVAITHVPGLIDAQGRSFGLFQIDPIDDVVHMLSALLAAFATWQSARASVLYLRLFGAVYGADAVVGLLNGVGTIAPLTNLLINLPHVLIAGLALTVGWRAYRRLG